MTITQEVLFLHYYIHIYSLFSYTTLVQEAEKEN